MANRQHGDASPFVPPGADLAGLSSAAGQCKGCDLYEAATQTVFGEGPASARVVLVGEQPGDQEDRAGQPFVGPAGRLLDQALEEAGVDRNDAYVTNAVKHFRFTQSAPGKRRIHQKPDAWQVSACRPWLAAEFELLDPQVVVALGAPLHSPCWAALSGSASNAACYCPGRRRPATSQPSPTCSRTTPPVTTHSSSPPCTPQPS